MIKKQQQQQKLVYKFALPTYMKFMPKNNYEDPQLIKRQPFLTKVYNRVRSFLSLSREKQTQTSLSNTKRVPQSRNPQKKESVQKSKIQIKNEISKLKYVKNLSHYDLLIGNQDQLDAISINGIIQQFVDTEYYWSIRLKKAISNLLVDNKKNLIFIAAGKELYVYKYNQKNIEKEPSVLFTIKLLEDSKFLQLLKDNLVICYQYRLEIYTISEQTSTARLCCRKVYEVPLDTIHIFKITNPVQNVINVIFNDDSYGNQTISLWYLRIQFTEQVKISKMAKLFTFSLINQHRKKVEVSNYSKDIFFINAGYKIFVIVKGYSVDVMEVKQGNKEERQNRLKFLSSDILMHITDKKIELYSYKIISHYNPPQVKLMSIDSIEIPSLQKDLQYLEVVPLYDDNFAIFYQNSGRNYRLLNGEVKYGFIITQKVKINQKINKLMPQQIENQSLSIIQQKADMFKKMGFTTKDIYLRLWNNSSKNNIEDYKFLMDTKDYATIKSEIDKKLKKKSMNYRQILLIEQGCLSMLSEDVFGDRPVKQNIKNYMISHFLLRKLQFYREISIIEKNAGKPISQDGKLMINIQNYTYYQTIDIKSMLIELILRFCNEDKDQTLKIRALIKSFKFPLRVIYKELLIQIINVTKIKFYKLIKAIPEFLPIMLRDESMDKTQEGIWSPITVQQWQKQLYHEAIKTVDNQNILDEIYSSVWFRSYWLTQHDFVSLQKQKIQEIHNKNRGNYLFYITFDKIFELIKDYQHQRLIIDHIQDNYESFPSHLYGKIFLYQKLYENFKSNKNVKGLEGIILGQFSQFLNWSDAEIFHAMFDYQKIRKGFILKEIKPLYARLSSNQTFLQGLLNFFDSNLSQISDIKYLLNRMNNEKKQFKYENMGIYEVVVRGMQLKFRIGGDNDIPMDDILIYIENIAFEQNNPVYKDIAKIKQLYKLYNVFKQLKLNLSIFEIFTKQQTILQQLLKKQLIANSIQNIKDYKNFKVISLKVYKYIQGIQYRLYDSKDDDKELLFIFLIKLLQYYSIIEFVKQLIQEQWVQQIINNDQYFIENLVLFMYKWKVSKVPEYTKNQDYLKKIVELLPQKNRCREYIISELQLALLLSSKQKQIVYPLNNGDQFLTTSQLQDLINKLTVSILTDMNIQNLDEKVSKFQRLSFDGDKAQVQTSLKDINEIIIIRLIDSGYLKEAISKIKVFMEVNSKEDSIIYPFLLISKIQGELIDESKYLLLEISSYTSNKPMDLLLIIEKMFHLKATTPEQIRFLQNQLKNLKQTGTNYDKTNELINKAYLSAIQTKESNKNFMNLIKKHVIMMLKAIHQDELISHFYAIYILICNNPWVIPKYIMINRNIMNFKKLRYFLTLSSKEDIFNQSQLLQFFKRIFYYLYKSEKYVLKLQQVIEEGKQLPLNEWLNVQNLVKPSQQQHLLMKLYKSCEKMKLKLKLHNKQMQKKKKPSKQQLIEAIKRRLNDSASQTPIQYFIIDSDNDKKPQTILKMSKQSKIKKQSQYNQLEELYIIMHRKSGGLQHYIGSQPKKQFRKLFIESQQMKTNIFQGLNLNRENYFANLLKNIGGVIDDGIRNSIRIRSRSRSKSRVSNNNGSNEEEDSNSLNKKNILQAFKQQMSSSGPANSLMAYVPAPHFINKGQALENVQIKVPNSNDERQNKESLGTEERNGNKQVWTNPLIQIFRHIFAQKQKSQTKSQANNMVSMAQIKKVQSAKQIKQNGEFIQPKKEQSSSSPVSKTQKHSSQIKQIGEIAQSSKIGFREKSQEKIQQKSLEPIIEAHQYKEIIQLEPKKLMQTSQKPQYILESNQKLNTIVQQRQITVQTIIPIEKTIPQAKQKISLKPQSQTKVNMSIKKTYEQPTINIAHSILQNQTNIDQNTPLNISALQKYQQYTNFAEFLIELIKILYEDKDIIFNDKLHVIKSISNKYPVIKVNETFLDIYIKAEKIQQKFHLFLPFDKIMQIQGLFIGSKQVQALFKFILPKIIQYLAEEQLFKACKVITLAFKKSELQHQILFSYIIKLLKIHKIVEKDNIQNQMMKQKLQGIFQKIPVKYLKRKQSSLMDDLTNAQKVWIAQIMIASFLKRYDQKTAQQFKEKYLT